MHSKWKIWDFLKSRSDVLVDGPRILAISSFDPLAFKMIKDSINKKKLEGHKLNVVLGKEITTNWFDDNFKTMDLFGNSESYLIHFANEMNSTIGELLLNPENLLLDGRYIILNFTKEDALFKKLQKSKSEIIETVQIQAPAFWEDNELLSFVCDHCQVYLSFPAKNFIKEKIAFDINSYNQLINQIKINFPEKTEITIEDIKPLISEVKVDQFELAELFGSKKLKIFYQKLIELSEQGSGIIVTMYFLQSHLLKMYDLSYLDGKSKLTKYDKQIMAQANLWKKEDLYRAISYIGELLTQSKRKDFFMINHIRQDLLKVLNF